MTDLDPQLVSTIAIAAAVVALVGLVLAIVLAVRIRRMRRQYVVLQEGDDGASFIDAVTRQAAEVDAAARRRGEPDGGRAGTPGRPG